MIRLLFFLLLCSSYSSLWAMPNHSNINHNLAVELQLSPELSLSFATTHIYQNNLEQAEYWYLQAGKQGNLFAQMNLGILYHLNSSLQDDSKAIYWYQQAINQYQKQSSAEQKKYQQRINNIQQYLENLQYLQQLTQKAKQGSLHAQDELAKLYCNHRHKLANEKQCLKLAEQNNTLAQWLLSENPVSVSRQYWLEQLTLQNNHHATFALALLYKRYLNEKSSTYEVNTIHEMLKKLAQQNHLPAQNLLAYYYQHGVLGEYNLKKALYWYQKASQQGLLDAQFNLALFYATEYEYQDYTKARQLWQNILKHHKDSDDDLIVQYTRYNLAILYAQGYGVAINQAYAKTLYAHICPFPDLPLPCRETFMMLNYP